MSITTPFFRNAAQPRHRLGKASSEAHVQPSFEMPPMDAVDEGLSFMPRDYREGEVASMAVSRFGAAILQAEDHSVGEATTAARTISEFVFSNGIKAANAYDVHRGILADNTYDDPITKGHKRYEVTFARIEEGVIPAQKRFEALAEENTLRGADAALVLQSLARFVESENRDVSPFDQATARSMLQNSLGQIISQ